MSYSHGGGGYYNNQSFASAPVPPPPPAPRLPGIGIDENLLGHASVHSKFVNKISWSVNGKRLATISDDKTARVYEVDDNGNVKSLVKLEGHTDTVVSGCWDPTTPNRLATISINKDLSVRLWDIRTGKATILKLNEEYLNIAWSPNGAYIALASCNVYKLSNKETSGVQDMMTIIDVKTHAMKRFTFPYQVEEFCFSPNSKFIILGTVDGSLEILDYSGEEAKIVKVIKSNNCGSIGAIAINPAGTLMAVGSRDGLISIWSLDELICLRTLGEHIAIIKTISFSPDGKYLVSADYYDTKCQISEVATGLHVKYVETGILMHQIAWQNKEGSKYIAISRDAKSDLKSDTKRSDFVRLVSLSD